MVCLLQSPHLRMPADPPGRVLYCTVLYCTLLYCTVLYCVQFSGFLLILLVESVAHKLFGGEGHSHFPAEKRTVTGLANNAFEV